MYHELIDKISGHIENGEEFAIAQVVWREAPSSGKPGDKAIIKKDGTLIGWIGGGCVRGIAVKEAQEAIRERKSRLVKIDPNAEDGGTEGHKTYKMTCHSGGTMELFIEPVLPNPQLVIVGKSNIARALSKMALAANLRVTIMASQAEQEMFPGVHKLMTTFDFDALKIDHNTFIVVATQGESDEESVKMALETNGAYVGFISSLRKSAKIKEYLTHAGVASDRIESLITPVGLDINAKQPEEIAISILAEIIKEYRSDDRKIEETESIDEVESDLYINPVCNVPVSKSGAKHIMEYGGHKVFFCCDGCKVSFDQDPDKYVAVLEERS